MENTKKWLIEVSERSGDNIRIYNLELETDRINWSLDQYRRNRNIVSYKILEINGVTQTEDSSSL